MNIDCVVLNKYGNCKIWQNGNIQWHRRTKTDVFWLVRGIGFWKLYKYAIMKHTICLFIISA